MDIWVDSGQIHCGVTEGVSQRLFVGTVENLKKFLADLNGLVPVSHNNTSTCDGIDCSDLG